MQGITTILLNNMTYISIAIIAAMVLIFLIGVINNLSLKMAYSKIIKELDAINNDGMEVYHNKMLNEIVSSYKEAYLKSYDGVNTQAIIESKFYKLDKGKIGKESFLSSMTPMLLTLGIVGTLYNIIVIVTSLTEMFKGVDAATVPSLASVLGNVSTIIAYLAIAFVTTFIAITLSFIYSVINSITHIEMERSNLFARLEDYLDNILGANLAKAHPRMLGGNSQEGYANTNILYMLENTSNSMIASTSKLEESIVKLSDNLKTMITNNEIQDEFEEKKNEIKLEEKVPTLADTAKEQTSKNIDELFKETEEEKAKRLEEEEKNQKAQRLKLLEESRRVLELKANEKLENMKNGDVVPNKDKVYVEEATKEVPKAEEFIKKEEIAETLNKSSEVKNNAISLSKPNETAQAMPTENKTETKEAGNSLNVMDPMKAMPSNNYSNATPMMANTNSNTNTNEINKPENTQMNDTSKNVGNGIVSNQMTNTNPYASNTSVNKTDTPINTSTNTNMNAAINPASSNSANVNNTNSNGTMNNASSMNANSMTTAPTAANTNGNTNTTMNANYQMSNQNSNLNMANSNYSSYPNSNTSTSMNAYPSNNSMMPNQTMQPSMAAVSNSNASYNNVANTTSAGSMNSTNNAINTNMNQNTNTNTNMNTGMNSNVNANTNANMNPSMNPNSYGSSNIGMATNSVKPSVNVNELKPVGSENVAVNNSAVASTMPNTNGQNANGTFNMGTSTVNMNTSAPTVQTDSSISNNTQTNDILNNGPKSDVVEDLKKEQVVRSLTEDDIYKLKQELIRKQEEEKRIQEIMNSKK